MDSLAFGLVPLKGVEKRTMALLINTVKQSVAGMSYTTEV